MIVAYVIAYVAAHCLASAIAWGFMAARDLPQNGNIWKTETRLFASFFWFLGLTAVVAHELTAIESNRLKRRAMRRDEVEELVRKAVRELGQ